MGDGHSRGAAARQFFSSWIHARFEESTHCRACGQGVEPFDSYCEFCGQQDPAKVELTGAYVAVTSVAVVTALAITGLAAL